ncbi:MAG TPA: hypothetical protein VFZ63_07620 [Jiangellaceae bacterium]
METWIWIVIVVLAAALAAALAYGIAVQRRSSNLKKRFGPEYDRAVDEADSRQEAESELSDIAERRDQLDIKPLPERARREYAAEWERVQRQFVEHPQHAVAAADDLIVSVMRDRGYPVDEFDDRTKFVSADYPEVASHYRSAHAIRRRGGDATTEDFRQAFVHYRALFDEMLVDSERADDRDRDDRDRDDRDWDRERTPDRDRADDWGRTDDRGHLHDPDDRDRPTHAGDIDRDRHERRA